MRGVLQTTRDVTGEMNAAPRTRRLRAVAPPKRPRASLHFWEIDLEDGTRSQRSTGFDELFGYEVRRGQAVPGTSSS